MMARLRYYLCLITRKDQNGDSPLALVLTLLLLAATAYGADVLLSGAGLR
jgi:hypothetical protein